MLGLVLDAAPGVHAGIHGEGYSSFVPLIERRPAEDAPETRWRMAAVWAVAAIGYAHEERGRESLLAVQRLLPAIERAPGWAVNYTQILYCLIEALWVLQRSDYAEMLERNLRAKTLASDFRYPHTDARLALARLCSLGDRFDEAREWFEKARHVLDEQGARPLRAGPSSRSACRGGCGEQMN